MKFNLNFKYFAFFCYIVFSEVKCAETNRPKTQLNILRDVPSKVDLNTYLNSLEKVLNFCSKYKNEIDINFEFGLFLVDVNLRHIAKVKHRFLPKNLQKRMTDLLRTTDDLQKFFYSMIKTDHDRNDEKKKTILTLFSNESSWMDRIKNFQTIYSKYSLRRTNQELEDVYSKWSSYIEKVDNVNKWVPKPNESDTCMASLAANPIRKFDSLTSCVVIDECYNILVNGSNFGYALTHRVLLLLLARLGRGCAFFSPMIDRELTRRFCTVAYEEAEYISRNGYKIVDLMFEQIALCTLDGHSQFLRRSWLNNLLKHQSPHGCFGQNLKKAKGFIRTRAKWKLSREQELLGGECHGHITAVAAATLATTIRFLLIVFY